MNCSKLSDLPEFMSHKSTADFLQYSALFAHRAVHLTTLGFRVYSTGLGNVKPVSARHVPDSLLDDSFDHFIGRGLELCQAELNLGPRGGVGCEQEGRIVLYNSFLPTNMIS